MKRAQASILVVVTALVICCVGTGCRTVTSTEVANGATNIVTRTELDPQKTASAIRAGIPAGVILALQKDPESEVYLRAAAIVLRAAAARGEYDPDQVQQTLQAMPVSELRTPEATAAISAAMGLYRAYLGDVVGAKLEAEEWAVPILKAIADGLWDALPAAQTNSASSAGT